MESAPPPSSSPQAISCSIISIQTNEQFKSTDTTVEYDLAVLTLSENLGRKLGYLGLLANARSDDFDIQSASRPIVLLSFDDATKSIEY